MNFSRILFRVCTAWWAVALVNAGLFVLVAMDLFTGLSGITRLELYELRGEDVSDIVVAWGVLLESREFLMSGGFASPRHDAPTEALLNVESARLGIMLLALGMLLEIVTYFDFDFRTNNFPKSVNYILNYLEWALLLLIGLELLMSCWKVLFLRGRRS